jgi:hypothetical protein
LPRSGWHDWFGTYDGVVLMTLALVPLAGFVVWRLARGRSRSGCSRALAWRRSAVDVGLVWGTLPGVWITLLPGSRAGLVAGRVSLVPLRDLASMGTFQVVGNLLILAAFGFLAPLRFAALASVPRILAAAALGSSLVEAAQYVLRLDRVSSVDDVLLNTVGAGLAALGSRPWWHTARETRGERPCPALAPHS